MKKYYVSMYRVHMMNMYDKGYISDPTRFNQKEIFADIADLRIHSMMDITGTIKLTSQMAMYSYYKYKDPGIREFLSILYQILRYGEYIKDVDTLYDNLMFENTNRVQTGLGLKLRGSRVVSKTEYGVSRAVLACFQDIKHTTDEYCFNDDIWNLAMQELGIPEEDWNKNGLFDKDLTHDQEVDFMDLLLDGVVPASGKYKNELEEWLFSHKWKDRTFSVTNTGLFQYIFFAKSDEVFKISVSILEQLISQGHKIVGMLDSKIWVEREIQTYNIPFSCICILGEEDTPMFEGGALNGYTGEVYSQEYIQSEGITCIGCPVELYVSPKEKCLFYDLEELDIKADSWFKLNVQNLDFYDKDMEILAPDKLPFKEGSLEFKLYEMYIDSLKGKLVGELPSLEGFEAARKAVMKFIQ